jgi:hypothetical protein
LHGVAQPLAAHFQQAFKYPGAHFQLSLRLFAHGILSRSLDRQKHGEDHDQQQHDQHAGNPRLEAEAHLHSWAAL